MGGLTQQMFAEQKCIKLVCERCFSLFPNISLSAYRTFYMSSVSGWHRQKD